MQEPVLQDDNQEQSVEFSIAILCYRSEKEVIPFVEKVHRIMCLFGINWEIVLVANFWPEMDDQTPEIAKELSERLENVRYIAKPKQGDMGWDMKEGLRACKGKYIGVIDGDGQFPVEAIFSCFAKIKSEDIDFVKTFRVIRRDGLYRNIISSVYNLLFRILFPKYKGFRDVNSKPKIMKREVFERMELHSDDWFIDAELVLSALRLDLKVSELPVSFESLSNRKSFVKPFAILEFMKNLFRYRFNSPVK